MIPRQRSTIEGIGLFTGTTVACTIGPGADGIVFVVDGQAVRADIDHLSTSAVHPAFAQMAPRSTNLEQDGARVFTVEHVLSALAGLGVTGATIELTSPEVPMFDGSAMAFVDAVRRVGLDEGARPEAAPVEAIRVEAIRVEDGEASITYEPRDETVFEYAFEHPHPALADGVVSWKAGDTSAYVEGVAPARTFSLEAEARQMQALGLFGHLSPRDMLVVGDSGPVENAWRFEDEAARHKLLDLIGDLSLAGAMPRGRIRASRSGHALNHEMARAIRNATSSTP